MSTQFGDLVDELPPTASNGARVAAGVGGVLLIVLACVATGGFALASFAAMGIAAVVWRARGRPYTPVVGWLSALFGAVLAFAALAAFAVGEMPRDTFAKIQQQAAVAAQHRPPPSAVQRTIERVYPGSTAIGQAQSDAMTQAMSRSPGFFWGMIAFSVVLGMGFFAAFVGSAAWGSATVLLYGVLGRWPSTSRRVQVATSNRARDAFDEI